MESPPERAVPRLDVRFLAGLILVAVVAVLAMNATRRVAELPKETAQDVSVHRSETAPNAAVTPADAARNLVVSRREIRKGLAYQPRKPMDTSAFYSALAHLAAGRIPPRWKTSGIVGRKLMGGWAWSWTGPCPLPASRIRTGC